MSNNYETAMCIKIRTSNLLEGNNNITIENYNDLYLIREQKIQILFSDNTSINRFVISQAILKLLQLIDVCHGKKSKLYAYNTDGVYIQNPEIRFKNKKDVKFKTKNIGRAFETDSELVYFEKKYRENLNMDDYKIENGKGIICSGCPGSGKTTKICNMKKCKKCKKSNNIRIH